MQTFREWLNEEAQQNYTRKWDSNHKYHLTRSLSGSNIVSLFFKSANDAKEYVKKSGKKSFQLYKQNTDTFDSDAKRQTI